MALTAFGSLLMILGVLLLFDKALLALGNVCEMTTTQPSSVSILIALFDEYTLDYSHVRRILSFEPSSFACELCYV